MSTWFSQSKVIAAVTLFVEDLEAARSFYRNAFGLKEVYEDQNSVVFQFGETMINLLVTTEAHSLIAPALVATPAAGVRTQFTVEVDDVDAVVEQLAGRGVSLSNGPMDRPWGLRTASFVDPGGHVWEVAGPPIEVRSD